MATPIDVVRLRIGSALRDLLAGDPEPRVIPDDHGLFGPRSATWRVHSDASMLVAGILALPLGPLHSLAL
ncbi:MAG: histidine kinase, partial [Acidimicrobiales bacterium]